MLTVARHFPDSIRQQSKNPTNPVFVNQTRLLNKQRYKRSDSKQIENDSKLFNIIRKENISTEQKLEKLKKLFNKKPKPNINARDGNDNNNTPLHLAIKEGESVVIHFILNKAPDKTVTNNDGDTPLALAKKNKCSEEILSLLDSRVQLLAEKIQNSEQYAPSESQESLEPPVKKQRMTAPESHQPSSEDRRWQSVSAHREAESILPPFSGSLMVDHGLNLKRKDIVIIIKSLAKNQGLSEIEKLNNVPNYPKPYLLAKFASAAYTDYEKNENVGDYEKRLALPEGWKLLTTATNTETLNGYFASAFWHPEYHQVVIAHRGTKPTTLGADWADVTGVLFNNYVHQMNSAVTFSEKVSSTLNQLSLELGIEFQLFFTGHSLGGWLAQITTFTTEYLHLKGVHFQKNDAPGQYHAHTVVFDSPGCAVMLSEMSDKFDVRYSGRSIDLATLDITSYLSAPNRINTCNTHVGTIYRLFTDLSDLSWKERNTPLYNLAAHNIDRILQAFDSDTGQVYRDESGHIKLQEVIDWPISVGLFGGMEYGDFFQWANHLNDYHPGPIDKSFKLPIESGFSTIRYQTKPFEETSSRLSVFTRVERQFLERYSWLQRLPEFFKPQELFSQLDTTSLNHLKTFEISGEEIHCPEAETLQKIIPYVKHLLKLFPEISSKAEEQLSVEGVIQQVYQIETKNYLKKIQESSLEFKSQSSELKSFLGNPRQKIWHQEVNGEPRVGLTATYQSFKKLSYPDFFDKSQHTLLKLGRLLTVQQLADVQRLFTGKGHLLMIECKSLKEFSEARGLLELLVKAMRSNDKLILVSRQQQDWIREVISAAQLLANSYHRTTQQPFTWGDLTPASQRALLGKITVNFQGSIVKLQQLAGSGFSVPDTQPLSDLLKPEVPLAIGKPISLSEGYDESYYIPRTINQVAIEDDDEQEGGIQNSYDERKDEDILKLFNEKKPVVIIDIAGVGKTTFLTSLSKKIKKEYQDNWVVKVDLKDHADALGSFNSDVDIIDFLTKDLLKLEKNSLEEKLFKVLFKKEKIFIILDGVDRVSSRYKIKTIDFLKKIKNSTVKQLLVTSRQDYFSKNELKDILSDNPYKLEAFIKIEQVQLITDFWKKNKPTEIDESTLKEKAEKLVVLLGKSIKNKDFAGVPLHAKMLADSFRDELDAGLPDKLDLMDLYRKFVREKYRIWNKWPKVENIQLDIHEKGIDIPKNHLRVALRELFDEQQIQELNLKPIKENKKLTKEHLSTIGLFSVSESRFIHRTFAEYFAADFFSKQIKIKETSEVMKDFIIKDIFIKSDYRVLRRFINDIFGKDGSPLEDIMKLYGDRVNFLWETDKEKLILSGWGVLDGTILAQGVREGNVEIVKFLLGGLKKGGHKETLKKLLLHKDRYGSILHRAGWETGTPDALDEIFKWIKYLKEENGSIMVTEDEIVKLLEAEDDRGRTLFQRISRWGSGEVLGKIFDFFKDSISEEALLKKDKEGPKGQSVWQRLGRGGNVDILDLLLKLSKEKNIEVGEIKDELLTKDKSLTTFNQAVKWGNIDILEKLVNLKDDYIEITPQDLKIALESTDNKGVKKTEKKPGRTVFHRAVYDNPDKQLDKQKRNHETWAQERQYSRIDVLNKLMEFCIKAELSDGEIKKILNKGNQNGNTALYLTVKKNLPNEKKWLNDRINDSNIAMHWATENERWDLVVLLLNRDAGINDLDAKQCGLLRNHIEEWDDENKEQLLEKIEQRLSALPVASVMEVAEQAGQVLEPMEVDEAGPSRCRRDLQGCGDEEREEQGRVFPYEPLEESVSVAQQRAARLQSQLALALVWQQREPADKLLQYQRYLGDILDEGAVNQSPREQALLHNHYQQAQQFFADNPKTTLLEVRADNFEPLAGHSVLLENGQQSLLVFNAGERYQLYSPDFNYRQRFQTRLGVSWSELSGFIRAFFAWKSGSGEYRPLVLTDQLPGKTLAQLQAAPYWEPDTLAPDSVLLAREQAGLIEGIPARGVRELVRVNGQVVDSAALHADFFQTPGIQLRVEKLHSVLTELTEVQRRALVQGVNKYHWSADSTLLETLFTEERPLLADYQQRVMNELKTADTLTPERLSEFSWQAMAQAIEKQPELPAELKQPVLDNLKAMHRTASQRAWAKGMATQTLFFLPDMIRAANTGQVGGLVGTAGMLAADGGVNHLYGRLLERLAPTLGEARLGLLQKLPVTSPVFKALTVYSIVELTKQLHSLPPNSEQRQTIKHRLGEQYVTIGIMAAELLGLETGPLWIGLMAEQLIFEAMTFRKENQLDIPFWEAFIMSLGFEQDKLQYIIEERQLVELNLATVDNINTQANPPYGWVLIKVPSLGPLTWQSLDESQVPPHIREEIINQPLPFSIFPSTTITREAASFRQIEHYELNWVFMTEGDEGALMTGNSASPTLGKLLNTTWHLGTYTAQETAIHMQWGPSGRSCQEDNVFLATPKAPLANYRRIASVTGKNYPFCLPRTPVKISGPGLAALYVNNHTTATEGAPRNLYLGFDPREGDITLLIQPSGLRELDNINRDYHPDAAPDDNGSYSLTVQVSNKGYPPAIMFQPQLGILMVEEKSRRLHSHYFISSDTAPFYLYDDALTTRIAISPPSHRPIGFIVRSYGPKGLIQLQTWSPNSTRPIPAFPPSWYTDRHAVNFKKALQPLLPHQVSTLYLPNKKYLQLMLDQQQIAGVLMLEAEQVEVLAAKGQDAYQSGIYMTTAVTRFTVTLVGHLQVMQGNTRLFFIGETPDNTTVIRYSTQPSAPHSPMYQLELPVLQPVLDSLCRLDSREIHFSTPGLRYAWVPDIEQPAVLKIMAPLNGQLAQLLLEQNGTTLSQLDEQKQWRIMAVDHYNQHATLDNQLVLQQVITGGNTTNLGVYQSAGDPAQDLQVVDSVYPQGPGDILWFQSPQGYPVLHRFASDQKMTLNGIDYQIADNRLSAISAQAGIIDGDQLIRYRTPTRRVGIRVASSLAESQLSWDKGELTINQLTLRNLPEQTPIDLGGQAFPLKALKESVHRPRHHHRRDIPRAEPLTSGAARHQPWTSTLFKEAATLLGGISWKWTTWGSTPTLTGQPAQPPQNSKITVDEYTSGHFQGLLQLLDLGVRQWTGQKYGQQPVIANGSRAEACVQAATIIEEFHQTLQGAARACGVKLSMTQRLDEMTLRNQVAQKLYAGQPQAIEELLQPVVQSLYQTLCSRATQKQADRFMAHWNRHNNQSVSISRLQQQWVSLPSPNNMTCPMTNKVDPLSIPQLPTRPLSRLDHLT